MKPEIRILSILIFISGETFFAQELHAAEKFIGKIGKATTKKITPVEIPAVEAVVPEPVPVQPVEAPQPALERMRIPESDVPHLIAQPKKISFYNLPPEIRLQIGTFIKSEADPAKAAKNTIKFLTLTRGGRLALNDPEFVKDLIKDFAQIHKITEADAAHYLHLEHPAAIAPLGKKHIPLQTLPRELKSMIAEYAVTVPRLISMATTWEQAAQIFVNLQVNKNFQKMVNDEKFQQAMIAEGKKKWGGLRAYRAVPTEFSANLAYQEFKRLMKAAPNATMRENYVEQVIFPFLIDLRKEKVSTLYKTYNRAFLTAIMHDIETPEDFARINGMFAQSAIPLLPIVVGYRDLSMVDFLLRMGASPASFDVSANVERFLPIDALHYTPFMYALMPVTKESLPIVQRLIQAGGSLRSEKYDVIESVLLSSHPSSVDLTRLFLNLNAVLTNSYQLTDSLNKMQKLLVDQQKPLSAQAREVIKTKIKLLEDANMAEQKKNRAKAIQDEADQSLLQRWVG